MKSTSSRSLAWCVAWSAAATTSPAVARAQTADEIAVRRAVEAVADLTQRKDLAGLDTLFAPDSWVRIIEGAGVNRGWLDYRDHHLVPELADFHSIAYRFYDVEPQVRGDVAWAPFRYDLAVHTSEGHVEVEGRGTAVLERRDGRWKVVHLHTSGRRKAPGG